MIIPSTHFRQIASVKIPRKDDTRSLSVTEVKCKGRLDVRKENIESREERERIAQYAERHTQSVKKRTAHSVKRHTNSEQRLAQIRTTKCAAR